MSCDVDLYCRICETWDIVYVPEAEFYYRSHPQTETRSRFTNIDEVKARFSVIRRLFRESKVLNSDPNYKRCCIKHRIYLIFVTALDDVRHGHFRGLLWLLSRTARFEPLPWWLPYFVCRYLSDRMRSLKQRMLLVDRRIETVPTTN